MAFQPVPNCFIAHMSHLRDGEEIENGLHFATNANIDNDFLTAAAAFLEGYWVAEALPLLPAVITWQRCHCVSLESQIAPQGQSNAAGGTSGGNGGTAQPSNVSFAIQLTSGFTGRSARGRNFWLGMPEAEVTENTVSVSYANSIQSVYNGLIGLGTVVPQAELVIVSRVFNKVVRPSGVAFAVTGAGYANRRVDSMRGRLP